MGINKRYLEKFDIAYQDIPETIIPIEFVPTSPYYHMEEWREVLPLFVPGVKPHTYWISNMGRVYTNLRSPSYPNGGIMVHSINAKGYHQINLKAEDKNAKKICVKITRLIMLHFRFVPGCQYLEVDHLDGNKDNNVLWNLEWVNPQENTHRAIRNGQREISYTSNENSRLLTDEEAKSLFLDAVSDTYFDFELAEKYNVSEQYVKYIRRGSIRPYLRIQYLNGLL